MAKGIQYIDDTLEEIEAVLSVKRPVQAKKKNKKWVVPVFLIAAGIAAVSGYVANRSKQPKNIVQVVKAEAKQAGTAAKLSKFYWVDFDDTLSGIAKEKYDDASVWHTIYDMNKDLITNPDLIYPNQPIRLPAGYTNSEQVTLGRIVSPDKARIKKDIPNICYVLTQEDVKEGYPGAFKSVAKKITGKEKNWSAIEKFNLFLSYSFNKHKFDTGEYIFVPEYMIKHKKYMTKLLK